jgi:hypothetical protein
MAGISLAEIDVGSVLTGAGQFLKDCRTAWTGKEPISADKAAELAIEAEKIGAAIETARTSILVAEASSPDKWTSRARPAFMYVFYFLLISLVIVAPFIGIYFPLQMDLFYKNVSAGFKAVPDAMWATFTCGYLGYTAARQYGKIKGSDK